MKNLILMISKPLAGLANSCERLNRLSHLRWGFFRLSMAWYKLYPSIKTLTFFMGDENKKAADQQLFLTTSLRHTLMDKACVGLKVKFEAEICNK